MSAGWGKPAMSNKWHFFVDGMSLCRKWGFFKATTVQGNDESPDNCAACRKARAKGAK